MSAGDVSQGTLDDILARALAAPATSEPMPPFGIHRIMCHRARVSDLPAGSATNVAVYDAIVRRHAALGALISTRHVGPFVVRLARGSEGTVDVWRIVESEASGARAIILTYEPTRGSEGIPAREAAHRYAAIATEIDVASDFDPAAHFFGEHRSSRTH